MVDRIPRDVGRPLHRDVAQALAAEVVGGDDEAANRIQEIGDVASVEGVFAHGTARKITL